MLELSRIQCVPKLHSQNSTTKVESEKVQLAAESDKLLSRVTEANDLRIEAEEKTRQLKSILQAIEEN